MTEIKDKIEDWGYDVEMFKSSALGAKYSVSDRATSQKVDYSVFVATGHGVVEIWEEPVNFNDGFTDGMKNAVPWIVTISMFMEAEHLIDLLTDENLLMNGVKQ